MQTPSPIIKLGRRPNSAGGINWPPLIKLGRRPDSAGGIKPRWVDGPDDRRSPDAFIDASDALGAGTFAAAGS